MTWARITVALFLSFLIVGATALAQAAPAAPPTTRPTTQPSADARPNSLNAPGNQWPMVDSQGRAYFRIVAPSAQSVVIGLGRRIPLTKFDNGVWYAASEPLPVGFHYYNVYIDGTAYNDPATQTFFGSSKWMSAIDIPDPAGGYYEAKGVPHGVVRIHSYHSKIASATRRAFIYTPPGYDASTTR